MIVIGLTGGIGTGKSTVSKYLVSQGAEIIDADKVGHETQKPHTEAWNDIVATWGKDLLLENEEIDRRKLGGIVFSDPSALQKLNQIMHPRMFNDMKRRIEEFRAGGKKVVVLEAAILIEANWVPLVDQVWVTSAPEETVIQRLQSRNGLTREQVLSRINSQMAAKERESHANVVIDTNCSLQEVDARVAKEWDRLMSSDEVKK